MKLTREDLKILEGRSVGQSNNPVWRLLRTGRITASNFYRVHTRVEAIRRNPNTDCSNLVKSFLEPTPLDHLPQIQRGRDLESTAIDKLTTVLGERGHKNVTIRDCGIFIDAETQYLGASPDGVVSCDCCPDSLAEIKCPTTELKDLPYLDSRRKLKHRHSYFGQIQGQMMITSKKKTWFFIFYPHSDCHLQLVRFDKEFCKNMKQNLIYFYELHMAPKLLLKVK